MIRTSRIHRLGFLVAYVLTTLLAQAGHLHGHPSPTETRCQTVCDDAHPHLSGHASPDLGHVVTDCPACQIRSLPHLIDLTGPSPIRLQTAPLVAAEREFVSRPSNLRPSCRAPPQI